MKRYVLVGTGMRGTLSYMVPMVRDLSDCVELTAVYDINPKRAQAAVAHVKKVVEDLKTPGGDADKIKIYTDFDEMLSVEKPDAVMITSKDCTHDYYAIKAMEAGCDVVSEKPLTTDEVKFNAIYDCMQRTGRKLIVTFNCRFDPFYVKIKELLTAGTIGEVLSVHYEWLLDTYHGASYFRRCHRERKNSGSLLIHKATHHFDLLNWFLDQEPVKVNALGTQRYYGPIRENRSERCLTCPHKSTCEYYYDIDKSDFDKTFYHDCEDEDGYLRDGCVFSDDIDIEDSVSVNIRYSKGTVASYSLTTHSPYEGPKIVFNGEEGRIEADSYYSIEEGKQIREIRIYTRYSDVIRYGFDARGMKARTNSQIGAVVSKDAYGGHNGSDDLIRSMIFRGGKCDPLGQIADIKAAAMSIGIGIAANKSMKDDRAVYVKELYDYLKKDE